MKILKRNFLWVMYVAFVCFAIFTHDGEHTLISQGPYAFGKYFLWFLFIAFNTYTIYCSQVENFFKSVKKINQFRWGRQIGIDLYIGVTISLGLMFFNEGSAGFLLIWLIPTIIFANQTVLLYMALNYDSIVAHFF